LFCQGRFNGYRELTEGEHVTFDIGQGRKGPQAQNIVRG
jgi:CspA family cold shock protein